MFSRLSDYFHHRPDLSFAADWQECESARIINLIPCGFNIATILYIKTVLMERHELRD